MFTYDFDKKKTVNCGDTIKLTERYSKKNKKISTCFE